MPLLKASILPHSPLLIPEIGKANTARLDRTQLAYQQIAEQLKFLGVDTVIIISPHQLTTDNLITINVSPELELNFQDFGLINKKTILPGDSLLADKLYSELKSNQSIGLISHSLLDHGSAVPAYILKSLDLDFKLVSITLNQSLPLKDALALGESLAKPLRLSNKRVAIIASCGLSHRLEKKSPGGYSPKGAKFDNKLIEYLNNPEQAIENILNLDPHLIAEAGECGLLPIITLLGAITDLKPKADTLAYQTNFGVGYLSLDFIFPAQLETSKSHE
ncbi:MAG: AmmeMemoRadiSam system protein B [Patescibacteria group bacterium]|jgi:aromatic ring-opening dioxygenase LigB subunit